MRVQEVLSSSTAYTSSIHSKYTLGMKSILQLENNLSCKQPKQKFASVGTRVDHTIIFKLTLCVLNHLGWICKN